MRLLLPALSVFALVTQPVAAAPSCAMFNGSFSIQDDTIIPNQSSCTMTCLIVRSAKPLDVSCQVVVKAGDTASCEVPAQANDQVIGSKANCDGSSDPVHSVEPQ